MMRAALVFLAFVAGVWGQADPEFQVVWSDFGPLSDFPDEDRININEEFDPCIPDNRIAVELHLGASVFLWKGVRLGAIGEITTWKTLVERADSHTPIQCHIFDSTLFTNYIVLWKRDRIAVRNRAVYQIMDAAENMRPGHRYTFNWIQDGVLPLPG